MWYSGSLATVGIGYIIAQVRNKKKKKYKETGKCDTYRGKILINRKYPWKCAI